MFKIGQKIIVCYNAAPLYPYTEHNGIIEKITPKGLLRIEDESGRSELYYPDTKMARGWNTLSFKEKN